jgi:hydroxypyruvate isomerase
MAQLSVCIEMLFKEYSFLDRIDMVAKTGLSAIEFWDWENKDLPAIKRRAQDAGTRIAALTGNFTALTTRHEHSPLIPERRSEFLEQMKRAVEVAHDLDCSLVILMAGNTVPELSRQQQRTNLVDSLREAARIVEGSGVTLALEPLNTTVNHPGYFLDTTSEGWQILEEVGSDRVKLLYDLYHVQIMEGNLIANLKAHLGQVGHIHIGDVPGRHEPGTGEINYRNVLRWIHENGYQGFMGLEYRVTGSTGASLERVQRELGLGSSWQF